MHRVIYSRASATSPSYPPSVNLINPVISTREIIIIITIIITIIIIIIIGGFVGRKIGALMNSSGDNVN